MEIGFCLQVADNSGPLLKMGVKSKDAEKLSQDIGETKTTWLSSDIAAALSTAVQSALKTTAQLQEFKEALQRAAGVAFP